MDNRQLLGDREFLFNLKQGVWLLGTSSWLIAIVERSSAALQDGYLSALDLTQIFTVLTFFISWLFLKPATDVNSSKLKPKMKI